MVDLYFVCCQELEKLYCEELTALSEVVDMYNRKLELSQCSESGIAPVSYTHLDVYKRQS